MILCVLGRPHLVVGRKELHNMRTSYKNIFVNIHFKTATTTACLLLAPLATHKTLLQVHVHSSEGEEAQDLVRRRRQVLPEEATSVPLPLERRAGRDRQASGRDLPDRAAVRGVRQPGGARARDGNVRKKGRTFGVLGTGYCRLHTLGLREWFGEVGVYLWAHRSLRESTFS